MIWSRARKLFSMRYATLSESRAFRFRHRGWARERVHTVNTQPPSPRLAKLAREVVAWFVARRYHRAAELVRGSSIIRYMLEGGDPFPPLTADVAERMREYYRPEVEKLEKLIGRDLSAWKFTRERPRSDRGSVGRGQ